MKVYLASTYQGGARRTADWNSGIMSDSDKSILLDYPYLLESFHYSAASTRLRQLQDDKVFLFLDSGAFSAFTLGVSIDINEYAQFIKDNDNIIEVASVLDGIGDPQLTLDNQKRLEDLGVEVLPCFHYGEPLSYLEHYVENYSYITLGGMVPESTKDLRMWLDSIWDSHLTNDKGLPRIKVHGFGLTVLDLMNRYPWYSVDSTSWNGTGRFGSIYFPTAHNKDIKLCMSDQSPKRKVMGQHYDSLSNSEKESVNDIITSKGFDPEELRSVYWKRDLWNILYFKDLCDAPIKPFFKQDIGLFT